jgi:hypothetical protein
MNGGSVATNLSFYNTNQASLASTGVIEYSTNAPSYIDNFFVTAWLGGSISINNAGGATDIFDVVNTAYLCGVLSGNVADVSIYWGTSDGVETPGNWTTSSSLGSLTPGAFSTNISGMSADTVYYYRCFATNSLAGEFAWASNSSLFMAKTMTKGEWSLVSSPVDYGAGQNKLNGALGTNLASGMYGAATPNGDWLWYMNGTDWEGYYLDASDVWRDDGDDSIATLALEPGSGFWLKRHSVNGPDTDYIGFAGFAPTSSIQITFTPSNWVVFAWPYEARAESAGTDRGWGFGAEGGSTKSYNWHYADNIVGYSPSTFMIYLSTSDAWNTRSTANPASVSLVPGHAYYYYHRGSSNLLWTAPSN